MVQFSDFQPAPEYIAFNSLIETGLLPNEELTVQWNDQNSDIHKFWDNFTKNLDKYNYGIRASRYNYVEKPLITCPYCGKSHYTELYSETTAVYYPNEYKDGKLVENGHNRVRNHYQCLECSKYFEIEGN